MFSKYYRVLFVWILVSVASVQLISAPVSRAFLVLTGKTGVQDTLYMGSSAPTAYEAPLSVEFNAGMSGVTAGSQIYCEWRVTRSFMQDGFQQKEEYLVRQDEITSYIFEDDGTFIVSFAFSYREPDSEIVPGPDQETSQFSINASDLFVPNAFSPNGDGINDELKIRVKSIVSFNMRIFSRWGQLVASGDQNSLEYSEGNDNNGYYTCWDGTIGGRTAPNGTYFIHIEAEGAGGMHYTVKSDINLLTGLKNESSEQR
ncbi:MAG: gliding motility-associated C-terminal domain-containing protein [Bacteroidaceae bacterium]|nr:gliding motility-associated C-terminal domain-containing protein [Bacteroidaceae bacterium]